MARSAAIPRGLRVPPPMTLATVLERRFGVLSRKAQELAIAELEPAVRSGNPSAVAEALERIERQLGAEVSDAAIEDGAKDVARRVDGHHRKLFYGALGAAVGAKILGTDEKTMPGIPGPLPRRRIVLAVKLTAEPMLLAEDFARTNAALIKTLRSEVIPALRDEVVRSVQFGFSSDEAADRLAAKWRRKGVPIAKGDMKPRLRVIARDQVSKLNAQVARSRMQSSGIDRFRWRSQGDNRVRPLHAAIDAAGEIYDWTTGHPTEGLPGEPVLCRCFPEAVVDRDAVLRAPGFVLLSEAHAELDLGAAA